MKSLKYTLQIRNTRTIHSLIQSKDERKPKWNNVQLAAQKALGFPPSSLSLMQIFSDQMKGIDHKFIELLESNRSIRKIAKKLLVTEELPSWGMIVLLLSKAADVNSKKNEVEWQGVKDIPYDLKLLAETTELLKISHLLHKNIINIDSKIEDISSSYFRNKLTLLIGDYLISLILEKFALIRNSEVQLNIAASLRDLSESEFLAFTNQENHPIPSKPLVKQEEIATPMQFDEKPFQLNNVIGNMRAEWVLRNILRSGSLLGKSCQSAMVLTKQNENVQQLAYRFGISLALALQVSLERDSIQEEKFSLDSAPVMLHLEHDPNFYEKIQNHSENVDYDFIRKTLVAGPSLRRTLELQEEFVTEARNVLKSFRDNAAKAALTEIIDSL